MKTILFCFFWGLSTSIYPTTINGRFLVYNYSDTSAGIKLQINTDAETEDLGGATFIINFDTSSLSFDNLPDENYNYTFHNFSGGNYEKAFLTKVLSNQLWVNIELNSDNEGNSPAGLNGWTDVVTISFHKKNEAETFWVEAQKNSLYWSVFGGDNKTMLAAGDFTVENAVTDNNEIAGAFDFELSQNYPNPFNPSTKIRFSINESGLVTLKVYNIMGEEVAAPVNEYKNIGIYEVDFNAKDLTAGVYFYKISTTNFSETKKMILIK